jgi:hypothetical protein
MRGLKIILWICAICFLEAFIFAHLPWPAINAWLQWMGVQPPIAEPITIFLFRISMAMFGMIGIFFVILAKDPLKYGAMLPLSAYGLLCYGILFLVLGIGYGLPVWIYSIDVVLGLVAGVLILVFQKRAIQISGN